jgi:hypothetical protein
MIENQIRKTEAHKINTNILFTILLNTSPTNLKDKLKKEKKKKKKEKAIAVLQTKRFQQ